MFRNTTRSDFEDDLILSKLSKPKFFVKSSYNLSIFSSSNSIFIDIDVSENNLKSVIYPKVLITLSISAIAIVLSLLLYPVQKMVFIR